MANHHYKTWRLTLEVDGEVIETVNVIEHRLHLAMTALKNRHIDLIGEAEAWSIYREIESNFIAGIKRFNRLKKWEAIC